MSKHLSKIRSLLREVVQSAMYSVEDATIAQSQIQKKSKLFLNNDGNKRTRQLDEEVEISTRT